RLWHRLGLRQCPQAPPSRRRFSNFANLTKVLITVARRAWSVCLGGCVTVLRAIAEGSGEPTAAGYGRRPCGMVFSPQQLRFSSSILQGVLHSAQRTGAPSHRYGL